ncbi:MAG: tryptophan synthase subunit alpha [Betaproteobacteria bacterium HGW-Betaproteobacteria-8]|nr:MAG: tryptophan synthase subunit alpha [Betaproteobacteria bacterium HGW-Betaproteobacteria-8]
MSRIQSTFAKLAQQNKKALIPYITAGDPHPKHTVNLMHALVESGADMIELGVPFSDPMADGPVIQRASERALAHHVGLGDVLEMVRNFRSEDAETPIILMGYANPVEAMGIETFVDHAKAVGVDGVLTVDYPPEECTEFVALLKSRDIDPIFLLSPTTEASRIDTIVQQASGFVYYVSLKGVTGSQNLDIAQVTERLRGIRNKTRLPIGVGFGVRDAATARQVAVIADAIVVGSRMVQEIENSSEQELLSNLATLTSELRVAIDSN